MPRAWKVLEKVWNYLLVEVYKPCLSLQVEPADLLKKDLTCRDYLDEAKNYQLVQSGVVSTSTCKPHILERTKSRKSYAGTLAIIFFSVKNLF